MTQPSRRPSLLPSAYMKSAWWIYRHPVRSMAIVAGSMALATLFGARFGGRR